LSGQPLRACPALGFRSPNDEATVPAKRTEHSEPERFCITLRQSRLGAPSTAARAAGDRPPGSFGCNLNFLIPTRMEGPPQGECPCQRSDGAVPIRRARSAKHRSPRLAPEESPMPYLMRWTASGLAPAPGLCGLNHQVYGKSTLDAGLADTRPLALKPLRCIDLERSNPTHGRAARGLPPREPYPTA
jgi:hypothetical protein